MSQNKNKTSSSGTKVPLHAKSQKRQRKEGTQEFFSKGRIENKAFAYNQAPINKSEAKTELLEGHFKPKKRSAFMANLYQENDELEDLKILGGEDFEDPEVDKADPSVKVRNIKADQKNRESSKVDSTSKVGKTTLIKGSVAIFAICETKPGKYAIVNHTRNMKGYIPLQDTQYNLQVGQLVLASVTSVGKNAYQSDASSKLQLSLEPESLYRSFTADKVTPGMLFQGAVETKEEKGYMLNFGFKDNSRGFLKYSSQFDFAVGELVLVQAKSTTSKLIKCERTLMTCAQSTDSVTINENTLRPGFLVNAKVAKIYENGLDLSYLGGMQGQVFVDHTGRDQTSSFKVGEKVQARVISHDTASKKSSLSLLPHTVNFKPIQFDVDVGQVFEKQRIERVVFGDSFQVRLTPTARAFLHKAHSTTSKTQTEKEKAETKELKKGSQLDKVRVKELNYFDGVPFLTMRQESVQSEAMVYGGLQIGQFVNATIDSVNDTKKQVTLRLNDFVKGTLAVEHMTDHACTQIPQRFLQKEKTIKVRVFSIEDRSVTFTKKDSLMKHDVPLYLPETGGLPAIAPGDTVVGVIVARNEQGFIIRGFGEVRGMLPIDEENLIPDKAKTGTIVKAQVIRNKKNRGLQLTMDKSKVPSTADKQALDSFANYLPNEAEVQEILQSFEQAVRNSSEIQGKSFSFRVVENKRKYYVLKTILEKKEKIAILPKPLASSFGVTLPLEDADFSFKGFVFQLLDNKIPIVSFNSSLAYFKDQIPQSKEDLQPDGRVYLGLVDKVDPKLGVTLRFPGFTRQVAIKDIDSADNFANCLSVGTPVRAAFNKNQRLSLKSKVLQRVLSTKEKQKEQQLLLTQFSELHQAALGNLRLGMEVDASVQLVKDYGLILSMSGLSDETAGAKGFTGFVVNEQRNNQESSYKPGQALKCIVMDIDREKQILDLSERLHGHQPAHSSPATKSAKAIVELTKDNYMIVTLADQRNQFGVCLLQSSINGMARREDYDKFFVGEEIKIQVFSKSENGLILATPSKETASRLVKETPQVTARAPKTDAGLEKKLGTALNLAGADQDQQFKAKIIAVTAESSRLLQVQIAPKVHRGILFSDIISAEDLLKTSSLKKCLQNYKSGDLVDVFCKDGSFTMKAEASSLQKGDLIPVRFVKSVPGYGVTVQIDEKNFGLIELCELSDEITANLIQQLQSKLIFPARIIDTDKKGRLMLSTRQSMIENWDVIYKGSTAAFTHWDKASSQRGNMRNRIFKFGAKLALQTNDVFMGYVTNISKAGCFVAIGHNTSVRIGLNELDDAENFDFQKMMPLGRQVCGRITKAFEHADGQIRFNASLRKSIVVHGVGLVARSQLKTGQELTTFVLAVSKETTFAQIKGSFQKVEVSLAPPSCKIGSLIQVRLGKVSADSIKGDYLQVSEQGLDEKAELAQQVYESIHAEALVDIMQLTKAQSNKEIDLVAAIEKYKSSELDEQIRDLQTLKELEDSDSPEDDSMEVDEVDSDAEDMKRIISKKYTEDEQPDSDQDSADADMASDAEQGEEESDEEGASVGSSASEEKQKRSGKQALRDKIQAEKLVRAKEAIGASGVPKSLGDFERLLVADPDQSYLWIQYVAFILEKVDIKAARKIAERAVQAVSRVADNDKLNLWIAFMNLESKFGDEQSLQEVTQRALDVNDRKKIYLQLIQIYREAGDKQDLIEEIYKKLCKKYNESLDIWAAYIQFCFENPGASAARTVLQRSLQALPKQMHVNIISKFAIQEYKVGNLESGRTMFEGIVTNYPKRMDIWAVYMDQEVKYGSSKDQAQARNLFERALSLAEIQRKPKKMKLVFRKYMEFEQSLDNKKKLTELKQRVEEYLKKAFDASSSSDDEEAKQQ